MFAVGNKTIANMNTKIILTLMLAGALLVAACSGGDSGPEKSASDSKTSEETTQTEPQSNKGIGPIDHVEINGSIEEAMAARGAEVFTTKCSACHKIDSRHVGPPMKGVTERREPEWIMNMILNPEQMLKEDEVAKQMLREYLTQMTYQNVSQEDARAILEYLRQVDAGA